MKKILSLVTSVLIVISLTSCSNANEISTVGKFDGSYEATDNNGITDTYYQFKANDGSVWWALTENQMGFIPDDNTEYTLTYDNNGTTKANKPCDCARKYECECEVYDDEFVGIREMKQ